MHLPHHFCASPRLPDSLEPLRDIAYNLWWSWNADAISLFRDIDPELWEVTGHNPAAMIQRASQGCLEARAADGGFVQRVRTVKGALDAYLGRRDRWFRQTFPGENDALIAYFSAEFGIHESLQTYSGGLGILAGDHCKSISDLGVPFVGVGLMYRQGYFTQRLTKDGWQESEYVEIDFNNLPVSAVLAADGSPARTSVELPGRTVHIGAWEVKLGTTRVIFLDTDLPENGPDDRKITYQLYGGDTEMRIKQEIVLGIGGKRFLLALGLRPTVFHMNEGHAAFLALERIRRPVKEEGANFYSVLQTVASSNVFTTHTPVPAGNDAFSTDLMRKYFDGFVRDLGIGFEEFLKFGRPWQSAPNDPFSMTILALRLSRFCNGVSKIHGGVSRDMWRPVWPRVPVEEIPITSVTNGIHTQTWIAPEIKALLDRCCGGDVWENHLSNPDSLKGVWNLPDGELWGVHCQLKRKLVDFVRHNVRSHRMRNQEPAASIREVSAVLDPEILTIGFARRFATYKRAGLLFRDQQRLARLLNHPERPIQFVFAGKAHPADEGGKRLIQQVYQFSRRPEAHNRVVFVENYDMNVARHLYHGVDVWLNNPTRPLEASGTSGEKVCPNGGVNCSVLDGWWDEAWLRDVNGWAIGEQLTTPDSDVQNDFDADSLYNLLENVIAPLYYSLENGVPTRWVQMMKGSIATIAPTYSTFRMVQEYAGRFYVPAHNRGELMMKDGHAPASALSQWKNRVRENWGAIRVNRVQTHVPSTGVSVGGSFEVEAWVELGPIPASDVRVEVYVRSEDGRKVFTYPLDQGGDGCHKGRVEVRDSGRYSYNVRVLPKHEHLITPHELRLITWA